MSEVKQAGVEVEVIASTGVSSLWVMLTDMVIASTRHLEGRLCTLMDAITSEERQVKAIKDTVKTLLWAEERETEKYIERYLFLYYRNAEEMGMFPDWLEKRLKKEDS